MTEKTERNVRATFLQPESDHAAQMLACEERGINWSEWMREESRRAYRRLVVPVERPRKRTLPARPVGIAEKMGTCSYCGERPREVRTEIGPQGMEFVVRCECDDLAFPYVKNAVELLKLWGHHA